MKQPLVSVLIPTYNSADWIKFTLTSVLEQTWTNLEIIVVDDGSTDATSTVVAPLVSPNLKYIRQSNKGASAARNRAFQESNGQYIQYLDADDLLAPDKVERQMMLLQASAPDSISSSAWGMFYHDPSESEFKPTILWQDYASPVEWLLACWNNRVWMQPSGWLTPRNLIERAGPWNESLSLHDDGEFFCRVLLQSTGVKFCLEAKSYYRKGIATSLSSQRNLKAVQSHLIICQLYEGHLLKAENSARSRNACAANYQNFIYDHYPYCPSLLKEAALRVKQLGGTTVQPVGSPIFMKMQTYLGWRLARRIENFAYKKKVNRTALKEGMYRLFETKDSR